MSFKTIEMHDEDEYFIKFKCIHPILYYSNNVYEIKKKEFQINLLNKLNKHEINDEELKIIYKNLIDIELQYKIILNEIEYNHREIEKQIKQNHEDMLSNYIDKINK